MNPLSTAGSSSGRPLLPAPPAGSGIQIVESSPQRLTLLFPPALWGTNAHDKFLLGWCCLLALMTGAWLAGFRPEPSPEDTPWLTPAVFTLFWMIAIGWGVLRLRSRNRSIELSIDRTRCVLRTRLFGRTTITEIRVTPDTLADLELPTEAGGAYGEVHIGGVGPTMRVAAGLSHDEKLWLIDRINQFLQVLAADLTAAGDDVAVTPVRGLRPLLAKEIPANSAIAILEDSPHRMRLSLAHGPVGTVPWVLTALVAAGTMYGVRSQIRDRLAESAVRGAMLSGAIAFHVVCGLLFALFWVYLIWRRTIIDLTTEHLELRTGVSWLSRSTLVPTNEIRGVLVVRQHKLSRLSEISDNHPDAVQEETTDCLVIGERSRTVLVEDRSLLVARQVAGLLAAKLASWNRNLDFREESR